MMLEKIKKFREYLNYIENHYNNIQKAWQLIKEKCKDKNFVWMYDDARFFAIQAAVENHDLSKLSAQEFTQYRQYFFPCKGEERNKKDFKAAWEHHKTNNLHHWQSWTKSKSQFKEVYAVEMVVDWVAMSYEFGDTAKEYYENNKDKINIPDWSIELIYEIFDAIYQKE
jgi:hypothetical protein